MYSFPSLPLFIRLFNFFNSFVLVLLLLTANLWLIFKFTVSLADKSDELNMKKITIAIDGFSSCGKSTMAKDLAREVGYIYIDSGAMYRAVTLYSIENGIFDGDIIDTEKLKKEIKRAEGMLSNERFISKAPEAKVQEEREKLEKYTQMLQQVQERMAGLKK